MRRESAQADAQSGDGDLGGKERRRCGMADSELQYFVRRSDREDGVGEGGYATSCRCM